MKIVKLYAPWCGPCKVLERMIVENGIEHESINIDSTEGKDIATKYGIKAIPTMLVLDEEDNLLRKMTGLPTTPEDLIKFVYEAD